MKYYVWVLIMVLSLVCVFGYGSVVRADDFPAMQCNCDSSVVPSPTLNRGS